MVRAVVSAGLVALDDEAGDVPSGSADLGEGPEPVPAGTADVLGVWSVTVGTRIGGVETDGVVTEGKLTGGDLTGGTVTVGTIAFDTVGVGAEIVGTETVGTVTGGTVTVGTETAGVLTVGTEIAPLASARAPNIVNGASSSSATPTAEPAARRSSPFDPGLRGLTTRRPLIARK